MGNCPSEFVVSPSGFGCVMPCPTQTGFEITATNGIYACTYATDPTIKVALDVAPIYSAQSGGPEGIVPYATLSNASVYAGIFTKFNADMAIAQGKVDKEQQVATAFANLQAAENVRDQNPDAYETARIAYYTLTQGETWLATEQQRVANTEAQPVVDSYQQQYSNLVNRTNEQQQTIDAVNGIKDNLISVQDDMQFSIATFQKQIDEITNKIQLDKKQKVVETQSMTAWYDLILNVLIILVACVSIFYVARRVIQTTSITPRTV